MNFKKQIGSYIFVLTGLFLHFGSVSFLTIGVEEMPESIKQLR